MRTFILGVGAQKAGTTWLFRHLSQSENFIKGLTKEYHLFDALHLGSSSFFNESMLLKRINKKRHAYGEKTILKNLETMKSFFRDEKKYFDYFDSILKNDTDFTADITPVYSGLSSDVLTKIKNEFNQRGIAVKVVFLMREPINRLESSIKMALKRNNCLHKISNIEMAKKMQDEFNSHDDLLRSNYSYTCQQIDQAFSEEEVFYGFYETLFSEIEIKRLSAFLNMQPQEFDATSVINPTAKFFKYPLEDVKKFRENVHDRYQFVSEKFNFDISIWDEAVSNMVEQKEIQTGYYFKNLLNRILINRDW